MNIENLLNLDRLGKAFGKERAHRRELYEVIERETGRHQTGILGPRGAGKTILLQQLAAADKNGFYLSADTLDRSVDLFVIVSELTETYSYRSFYIDEIHYLDDGFGALKKIFDFLSVRIVFTSSVALRIHEAAHDLSRRVRLHSLGYFSFREYLAIRHGEDLPILKLDDLLNIQIPSTYLRTADRFERYLTGAVLPFALEEPHPLPLLASTIETIISKDIPRFLSLKIDELDSLRKMIEFIGKSEVDGINYSSLSANLGITKYKAEQYTSALERAFVLQRLLPKGNNVLKEPKILLTPPLRLLYRSIVEARGGLREDFFIFAFRQAGYHLSYLKSTRGQKTPDFLLSHNGQNLVFEVGGKGKGRSQFKGIKTGRKIVFSEGGLLSKERIPLHLAGMLA